MALPPLRVVLDLDILDGFLGHLDKFESTRLDVQVLLASVRAGRDGAAMRLGSCMAGAARNAALQDNVVVFDGTLGQRLDDAEMATFTTCAWCGPPPPVSRGRQVDWTYLYRGFLAVQLGTRSSPSASCSSGVRIWKGAVRDMMAGRVWDG